MKYIVLRVQDQELPVIFPEQMIHSLVAEALSKMPSMAGAVPVSAGQLSSLDIGSGCHGNSTTLGLSSRGVQDDQLIQMMDYLHGIVN